MTTIGSIQPDYSILDLLTSVASVPPKTARSVDNVTRLSATNGTDSVEGAILVSLAKPESNVNLSLLLQSLQVKLDEQGIHRGKEDIEAVAKDNKERHKEAMEALEKSIREMNKAQKSGKFAKIFGWIAAAATVVAGVAMMATVGGAAAGVLMLGLAVDQMVGMATGKSGMSCLTNKLADAMGGNMILATIIVAAIVIVLTLGAGYAGSVSSSSSKLAAAGSKTATEVGKDVAAEVPETLAKHSSSFASRLPQIVSTDALHQTRNVSMGLSAASQVGGAATGIDASVHKHEADKAQIRQTELRTVILKNRAHIDNAIEHIKKLTEHSEGVMEQMINTINQETDTNRKLMKDTA